MTIDPNLLSVTMHLRELDRQALELHRSRQLLNGARSACPQNKTLRFVRDWTTKVTSLVLAPRPTHRHGPGGLNGAR